MFERFKQAILQALDELEHQVVRPDAKQSRQQQQDSKTDSSASSESSSSSSSSAQSSPCQTTTTAQPLPCRVFVIAEDVVSNVKILTSMLRSQFPDCAIEVAPTGMNLVQKFVDRTLVSESVCAVFMDICMPELDGNQATTLIRHLEQARRNQGDLFRPVYICACTTNVGVESFRSCIIAGMNAFLQKPVSKEALAEVLVAIQVYHHEK